MDQGRSFVSDEEFRQRRKKKGTLPLAVFLSFNDNDVHPHCPNAFNSYHKCSRHCLDKIPSNKLSNGYKSGSSSTESEKMFERSRVNPACPNSSNPYHKCADYCYEKMSETRQDVEKGKGILTTADKNGVNPTCKHASNPYHKCGEFCFEDTLKKGHREGVMKQRGEKLLVTKERVVDSECKYASNPYHVCTEYCFQKVPERDQPVQVIQLKKLKERKNVLSNGEMTYVNPWCRYAANPYHKCDEFCLENAPKRNVSGETTKSREGKMMASGTQRRDVNEECKNASNPYHKCDEYCNQVISENNQDVLGISAPMKGKNRDSPRERRVDHPAMQNDTVDFKNVEECNSRHNYSESTKLKITIAGSEKSESVLSKEEKDVEANMVELRDTQPLRIDASDLFHEWAKYCSLKAAEENNHPDQPSV